MKRIFSACAVFIATASIAAAVIAGTPPQKSAKSSIIDFEKVDVQGPVSEISGSNFQAKDAGNLRTLSIEDSSPGGSITGKHLAIAYSKDHPAYASFQFNGVSAPEVSFDFYHSSEKRLFDIRCQTDDPHVYVTVMGDTASSGTVTCKAPRGNKITGLSFDLIYPGTPSRDEKLFVDNILLKD